MIVTPRVPAVRITDRPTHPDDMRPRPARGTRLRVAGTVVATLLVVVACGSPVTSGIPASGAPGSTNPNGSTGPNGGSPGSDGTPGASTAGASATAPITTAIPLGVTSVAAPFAASLLIADRGNGRLLVISNTGWILWKFPVVGSLPKGQAFAADDAFISPDGKTIVANDEDHQVIDRIDIATRKVIWQYGTYDRAGSGKGQLHTPDDAYPLANGDVMVADIGNCRVLLIAPDKSIRRQWGRTGVCVANAPYTYGSPNGATPLPDGGVLITQIRGSRVTRLNAAGKVIFDIHVPLFYPSDAQLDANGNVVVADYHSPGAVIGISPKGKLLWRYGPKSGPGRLDHPSLATPLPNGLVSINDDDRQRIVVIDPRTLRIVWQYGHTDRAGTAPGYLSDPDGHQPMPPGIF